jgi:hypothetical protein
MTRYERASGFLSESAHKSDQRRVYDVTRQELAMQ